MQSIQFDPKITSDLQIDRRRPASGQASDLFADLLADRMKRNAEAEPRSLPAARPHPPAEAVSGRPRRPVIEHPRTLRGEAKEIEEPGNHIAHHKRPSPDETGGQATATATEGADSTMEQEGAELTADTDLPGSDTAATKASGQLAEAPADPAVPAGATAVVPTQQSEQPAADDELTVPVELPVGTEPVDSAPDQAGDAAAEASEEEPQAETAADAEALAPDQQKIETIAAAGLSQIAADVKTDIPPTEAANVPVVATQPVVPSAAMPVQAEAAVRITLLAAPASEALPAPAQPQPAGVTMDAKLRPNSSARAHGGAPAQTANTAAQQQMQTSQPPLPATLPPSAAGEFDGMPGMFEHPLSADGAGPGWTLHLAQGAASRRAEFVAQLRQHLQNLPAHEQVAVHVQRAVREGTGRLSVQLSPAELGRIHVKLEIDEDKRVTAAVTVERPSTLELLQRDIRGLERALHNAGLAMEGGDLSFSLGSGDGQQFAQDLNERAASAAGGSALDGQATADQPAASAAQLLDTAAGVLDLQV